MEASLGESTGRWPLMKLSKELKKVIVQIRSVGGYDLVQINVSLYSETKKKPETSSWQH